MEIAKSGWSTLLTAGPLPEEAANCVTHGAGLALSVCGMNHLLAHTSGHGTAGQVAGVAVFGGSMVVLYLASTLYHAIQEIRLKSIFRIVDHAMIYLLIAGTYTPFLLALPHPWPAWTLSAIWSLAAMGVFFKAVLGPDNERLSVTLYLAMGWLGIIAVKPLVDRVSAGGVAWLVAGGLAYTVGTLFFVRRGMKYSHAVWHIFVILGSALHYGAVALYVVPRTF